MKLTVERMPESQVLLDIAAEDDEFTKAMDRAYKKVAKQVNVPGFRPGKAPRFMIERLYGREIIVHEAHHLLMDDLYRQALQQVDLTPVGEPANVEIVEEEPLQFKVTVPVYPTIDPGDYQSVRIDPRDAAVEDSQVDEVLERIRKSESPWVDPAEPRMPREGDQVTIDLTVKEGEEQFDDPVEDAVFVLGESNLFEQLRAEIERLNVGDTSTFDITFADDDENVSERVRGRTLTYTVSLKGLKERELVALDDDFAKQVNESPSLEALRQEIRNDIHRARTEEQRTEVVNEIINQMAEGASIEVPAVMVDDAVTEELDEMRNRLLQQRSSLEEYLRLMNQTEDDLKEEVRPTVARRLRNSLLLREIAKREEIDVTDDDIEAEIEQLTAGAQNATQLRELYQQRYFRGMLRNDLYDRRLTDRIVEIATEGRGAVLNPWVAPERPSAPETETSAAPEALESQGEGEGEDDGAAGAAMGIAAAPTEAEPAAPAEPAVSVEEVAQEPDVEQAAAVGHEAEQEAVGSTSFVVLDGEEACPDGFPIKGNASSKIYHIPGQSSYDRTIPEICFASEAAAVAEGYRASKAAGGADESSAASS